MRRIQDFACLACLLCVAILPAWAQASPTKNSPANPPAKVAPMDLSEEEDESVETPNQPAKADADKAKSEKAPSAKDSKHEDKSITGASSRPEKPAGWTREAKKPLAKKAEKKATVVAFTIKGDYPEGPTQPGLFGEMQPSLATLIERMDQAAERQERRRRLAAHRRHRDGRREDQRIAGGRRAASARPESRSMPN